jgi:hypothetical protein
MVTVEKCHVDFQTYALIQTFQVCALCRKRRRPHSRLQRIFLSDAISKGNAKNTRAFGRLAIQKSPEVLWN